MPPDCLATTIICRTLKSSPHLSRRSPRLNFQIITDALQFHRRDSHLLFSVEITCSRTHSTMRLELWKALICLLQQLFAPTRVCPFDFLVGIGDCSWPRSEHYAIVCKHCSVLLRKITSTSVDLEYRLRRLPVLRVLSSLPRALVVMTGSAVHYPTESIERTVSAIRSTLRLLTNHRRFTWDSYERTRAFAA